MNSKQKMVLVISDQDMLKAGNQVLYRTIEGYLKASFKVIFLTNEKKDDNIADTNELFGPLVKNLQVIRIAARMTKFKVWGKNKKTSINNSKAMELNFPPLPESAVPFLPTKYAWKNWLVHRYFDHCIYRKAMEIAKKDNIDLVCGYEVMAAKVASSIAKRLRVPFITHYQGTFLKSALNEGKAKELYPIHLEGTKVKADIYVMENDGTGGKEVLVQLGHDEKKILFLIGGVSKNIYNPDVDKRTVLSSIGINIEKSPKIILTLSKLNMWKRHDRIIGAMPDILQKIPEAYLVIAHRGPMRPLLEQYACNIGVGHNVIFTGPIPHNQIHSLLNACDVYVNCNDHSNLSNTVLEALECGKPVVSINDGSLDGIITSRENGLLVNLANIRIELPAQIIRLLKDDILRIEIGHRAREFARNSLLSWDERMAVEVKRIEGLIK